MTLVPQCINGREHMAVGDLSSTRLMAPWRVCYLDMSHSSKMFTQCSNQLPLHTLHMIEIVLVLEIRAVHLSEQLQCLARIRKQVVRGIKDIESLDHHVKPSSCRLVSSPCQILPHPFQLRLTALTRN